MAKYKATPEYKVVINDEKSIIFNLVGEYETDDAEEIKVLDGLAPRYIEKVESEKSSAKSVEKEVKDDKAKPGAKRTASGK